MRKKKRNEKARGAAGPGKAAIVLVQITSRAANWKASPQLDHHGHDRCHDNDKPITHTLDLQIGLLHLVIMIVTTSAKCTATDVLLRILLARLLLLRRPCLTLLRHTGNRRLRRILNTPTAGTRVPMYLACRHQHGHKRTHAMHMQHGKETHENVASPILITFRYQAAMLAAMHL
ncbi:hypothetical protein BCR44DRAFT_406407 [Catenaria anguillulae PL171]|uniref:Uncharacterized protein n=1 Tax=Catenaria anguillulae PL171 TaxID=765915 RepID=A0A1Y2HX69_9FUNG|nr:hypothetical protein BCR44DRAFT_406407 [Catenaria anguillulae PL171]